MIKKCISRDWKFSCEGADWADIDLPHDYMIETKRLPTPPGDANVGFYQNRNGRYAKYLELDRDKHYILNIDGAYMCSSVLFNEHHLAKHPYGYSPYLVDLPDDIKRSGTNKLLIKTEPVIHSSRWYSGNGLYRDVFLWEGGRIRIEPWDMFISTVKLDEKGAEIRLKYTVTSQADEECEVRFVLFFGKEQIKEERAHIHAAKDTKTEHEYLMRIENPKLWDLEHTNMYTLKTEISAQGVITDASENEFGVRTISADAKRGLLLNGKPLKLRGGCIHHDHGVLGAAAFPAAEERKIRLLKEAGFNAVRTAHNPPSLALLEACDRLGMVVMDEAFDEWNKEKCVYHWWFDEWCKRDVASMVLRERNHPCVFSYSIGNEIFEIDGTSRAEQWSRLLVEEIKRYDDTRFATSGINKGFSENYPDKIDPKDYADHVHGAFEGLDKKQKALHINKITAGYEEPLDIVGCNYYYENYLTEHECYPERVIWGSETHAIHFYHSWELTKNNNYILGDFTWTAFDNMGEVGAGRTLWARDGEIKGLSTADYPWRCCYQGDLDLCGTRRPQSYFREAVWLGGEELKIFTTHPEHFGEGFSGTEWHWYDVYETWSFDDAYIGRLIEAEVYTTADTVKWYVNGSFVGESVPKDGIAKLKTTYEPGCISAAAEKDGQICAKGSLNTVGEKSAINVTAEKDELLADNRDLCYFDITVADSEGRVVMAADDELKCVVSGGELLGIFSGNPCNEDSFTSNSCHAFLGRALAIVRTKTPGEVGIKVYADKLAAGFASVQAKKVRK